MKRVPLNEIKNKASVVTYPEKQVPPRQLRRERLKLFALALERYDGPVKLFSRIEYLPRAERDNLRTNRSPLEIAYQDTTLRALGLEGDRLGDAVQFFDLTKNEVHGILCDCHYGDLRGGHISSRVIAERVHAIADRLTFAEVWQKIRSLF